MARLDISNIEWNGILRGNLLEEFKQYASIPDGSRDAMLLSILKNAILKVQEYGDRALIPCTVTQVCRVPPTGVVRLYLGGGDVYGLSNTKSGDFVPFDPLPGGKLILYSRGIEVRIVFQAKPAEADLIKARTTILRYATALYDGEEVETLNKILSESLC